MVPRNRRFGFSAAVNVTQPPPCTLARDDDHALGWSHNIASSLALSPQLRLCSWRTHTGVSTVLRGTILNRTYDTHENLHTSLFLLAMFGPIY